MVRRHYLAGPGPLDAKLNRSAKASAFKNVTAKKFQPYSSQKQATELVQLWLGAALHDWVTTGALGLGAAQIGQLCNKIW